MFIKKVFYAVISATLLYSACASAPQQNIIPREDHPYSILLMPPINRTVDVRAPAVFLANSTRPLADSGYYVIPVALSETIFRQNGIMAAEEAHALPQNILRDIFGADAAIYIVINSFGPSFQLFRSVVQVSANAKLVDLRTGEELWTGKIFNESGRDGTIYISGGNIIQQLLFSVGQAAIDQVINTVWDPSLELTREAINQTFSAGGNRNSGRIPFGPYHPRF
jgi:hypothetical protein